MDAAVLTMVAALFAAVLASAFDQRREAAKTRDKLDENSNAVRELATRTTILEASHQNLHEAIVDQRRVTEKNHAEMTGSLAEMNRSLADARERLARIEGRLEIGFQPNPAA
ncbi:MAG: hypothetical protein OXN44_10565 [Acidimicrobiaceae bacterium]|nr:hypothetical protein [Acidimicrobiaceae bacterium]